MHVAASAVVGTLRTEGEGSADGVVLVGAAGAGADDVLAEVVLAEVVATGAAAGGADAVVVVLVLCETT